MNLGDGQKDGERTPGSDPPEDAMTRELTRNRTNSVETMHSGHSKRAPADDIIRTARKSDEPSHDRIPHELHGCGQKQRAQEIPGVVTKVSKSSADSCQGGTPSCNTKIGPSRRLPSRDCLNLSCISLSVPACMLEDTVIDALKDAPCRPPVTIETLEELDLHYIQNNINLRVDVHFDHDLHFIPISGRRGQEKRDEARAYWACLAAELRIYDHYSRGSCQYCTDQSDDFTQHFPPRLPAMFTELRALLLILVPDQDHHQVKSTLDVGFLMQQLEHGVLDIGGLSHWMSSLLISHCAPIRDEWAEEMAQTLTEGAVQGDLQCLVSGLEKLFTFCEAMKLDVANHQIRTFRVPLIEDGVSFQRDYFAARIRNRKLDIRPARNWYNATKSEITAKAPGESPSGIGVLVEGLVQLCSFPTNGLSLPLTLRYDEIRIQRFEEEVQDLVQFRTCCTVVDALLYQIVRRKLDTSHLHHTLELRLLDLIQSDSLMENGTSDAWQHGLDGIALEITRLAYAFARQAGASAPEHTFAGSLERVRTALRRDWASRKPADGLKIELVQLSLQHISSFESLSSLAISQAQHFHFQNTSQHPRRLTTLDDVARRLAHIAVIHWRVWGDLAYTNTEFA